MMLSKRLRELRLEHQMTQQELSEVLGIDRTSYTYYELGKTSPSPSSLCKLARIYNVTVDYLLGVEKNDAAQMYAAPYAALSARTDPISELPKDERRLLMYYRTAEEDERKRIMRSIQRRKETATKPKRTKKKFKTNVDDSENGLTNGQNHIILKVQSHKEDYNYEKTDCFDSRAFDGVLNCDCCVCRR